MKVAAPNDGEEASASDFLLTSANQRLQKALQGRLLRKLSRINFSMQCYSFPLIQEREKGMLRKQRARSRRSEAGRALEFRNDFTCGHIV